MTDEQQPIIPPVPPTVPEIVEEAKHTTKLEQLPVDIKTELDELILAGNGSYKAKDVLEQKFKDRTPILPADVKTYRTYINENKERLQEEAKLRNQLLDFSKEEMEIVQQNVTATQDATLTGELQDIRDALQKLQSFMAKRIDDLTKLQNSASPINRGQYETYIGGYVKEMHSVLETLLKHQEELKSNVEERFAKRSQQIYYLIVKAGLDAYKTAKSEEEFALVFTDKSEKILRDFALEENRNKS